MTVDELNEWTKAKYYPTEWCTSLDGSSSCELTVTFRDCDVIPEGIFGANFTDYGAFFHMTNRQLVNNIKKVIFNPPATIIIWHTGEKTVVKCKPGEKYDRWTGFAMCLSKYLLGEDFHGVFRKFCDI